MPPLTEKNIINGPTSIMQEDLAFKGKYFIVVKYFIKKFSLPVIEAINIYINY